MSTPYHFQVLTWITVTLLLTIILPLGIYNTYTLHKHRRDQFINARKPQLLLLFNIFITVLLCVDRVINTIAYGIQPSPNLPLVMTRFFLVCLLPSPLAPLRVWRYPPSSPDDPRGTWVRGHNACTVQWTVDSTQNEKNLFPYRCVYIRDIRAWIALVTRFEVNSFFGIFFFFRKWHKLKCKGHQNCQNDLWVTPKSSTETPPQKK